MHKVGECSGGGTEKLLPLITLSGKIPSSGETYKDGSGGVIRFSNICETVAVLRDSKNGSSTQPEDLEKQTQKRPKEKQVGSEDHIHVLVTEIQPKFPLTCTVSFSRYRYTFWLDQSWSRGNSPTLMGCKIIGDGSYYISNVNKGIQIHYVGNHRMTSASIVGILTVYDSMFYSIFHQYMYSSSVCWLQYTNC